MAILEGCMIKSSQRAAPASAPTRAIDSPDVKRRRFLLALGAGGAGAAAVATNALARPVLPAQSADTAESSQGYRETDHVRNYYATTRI
jgi:hypothetical protein